MGNGSDALRILEYGFWKALPGSGSKAYQASRSRTWFQAIERLGTRFDVSFPEFTVTGVRHDDLFAHHWFLGVDSNISSNALREAYRSNR